MRKDITFKSDRLPALAGIARKYQATMGYGPDSYVAGFWKQEWYHLLWKAYKQAKPCEREADGPMSAPSWSWANADAEVELGRHTLNLATVTSVEGNPVGLQAFGAIDTIVMLNISCIAICQMQTDGAAMSAGKSEHQFHFFAAENSDDTKSSNVDIDIHWDIRKSQCPESVYILPLLAAPWASRYEGLVLEKVGAVKGRYRRLGSWSCEVDYYDCMKGRGSKWDEYDRALSPKLKSLLQDCTDPEDCVEVLDGEDEQRYIVTLI